MPDIRNDLAALNVRRNPYTVPSLANPIKVATTVVTTFPVTWGTSTVQSGRSLGAAVTAEAFATNALAATLVEILDRQVIDDRILAQYNGLAGAQVIAATRGLLGVQKGLEQLFAEQVLDGGATVGAASTDWLKDIRDAAFTIRDRVAGQVQLACGYSLYVSLIADTDIVAAMAAAPSFLLGSTVPEGVRNIRQDLLAAALGVDKVVVGGTDVWDAVSITNDTCVAVMPVPNGAMTAQEEAVGIMHVQQTVDNASGVFSVSTYYSEDLRSQVVDTVTHALVDVVNTDLISIVKLS